MKRFVVAVVVAGLLIATTASGVVAKTTKIEVAGTATTMAMVPGTETWVGSVQSVRGLVLVQNGVWNSVYLTGPQVETINFDLDYATGRGEMWGSGHHDVTAVPGAGWDCRFHATIVNLEATGKGVCQGTGTLHTWQWRATMHLVWGSPVTELTGYFFEPGH
jgi:hypothetical protein